MQTILHKNDLSDVIDFSNIVAADCEMMGLQPNRDPLCLMQPQQLKISLIHVHEIFLASTMRTIDIVLVSLVFSSFTVSSL